METLQHVFLQICLPVFVMLGLGWIMDKVHRIDLKSLVKFNLYLFVPAFIFVQIVESEISGMLAAKAFFFTLAMILIMLGISVTAARLMRWSPEKRKSYCLSSMFQNAGNYGIPLMALAYPGIGTQLEVFVIAAVNISTFTIGILIASSDSGTSWKRFIPVMRQVSVWAILAAFAIRLLEVPVMEINPVWVPLTYLKNGLVPVALITLGVQLSQTKLGSHPLPWLGFALTTRLLVAPLIALVLVRLFRFEGDAASVMILSTAFPTAVNVALIAHEFKADSGLAASAVFYSTLASMITVTAIVSLLHTFA